MVAVGGAYRLGKVLKSGVMQAYRCVITSLICLLADDVIATVKPRIVWHVLYSTEVSDKTRSISTFGAQPRPGHCY